MTTLELFKKHRQGEVSRERFLYEVRRDNNLPWVTNTTSYDDAVKILKNKGIIRESAVVPENTLTVPEVDRVNPYFLKKGVQKELENNADLNNNSYEEALNKAAKKLAKDPHAFDDLLIHNASDIHKKDEKLQTKEVKGNNHIDKDNGMKKMKGQTAPKATSAPTKENRKTKKPKGVEVMKDKGVEGSEKIIKEIADFIKKKIELVENSPYHDFHQGMKVETKHGPAVVKEINGGTLTVETEDGKLYDVQMNHASHMTNKKQEEARDLNDPALSAARAKIQQHMDNPPMSLAQFLDKRDQNFALQQQIKDLKRELRQTLIDMEQEAEPEGGPIADDYADRITHLQDQIKALEAQLHEDEIEEAADVVSYTDASTGQKKVAGIYPSGKGSSEVSKLKTVGVSSAAVDRAK